MATASGYSAFAARLKYFVGLSADPLDMPESNVVSLEWKMPEGSCRVAGSFENCRSVGARAGRGSWFTMNFMMVDVEMAVDWGVAVDHGYSMVKLRFTPRRGSVYPMLHDPGLFFLSQDLSATVSATHLQVGNCKMNVGKSKNSVRVSLLEEGSVVEWMFELKDQLPRQSATFDQRFGSSKVELTMALSASFPYRILCSDVTELLKRHVDCSTALSDRDSKLVKIYRRDLLARPSNEGFFVLKSEDHADEIRVMKCILASRSRVFATCFQHPEVQEYGQNCYVVPESTPEGLRNFALFCEHLFVADMGNHCLELAKLAHKYEVKPLLDLCELHMMGKVSSFMEEGGAPAGLEDNFPAFLEICKVAGLLELPLLLVQLHYIVVEMDRGILDLEEYGLLPLWEFFLTDNPVFWSKRYGAIKKIKNGVVKKRKLEEDAEEAE